MTDIIITKFDQFQLGEFLKFVDKDKKGKFSYVGKIVDICDKTKFITINTYHGLIGFKIDISNELYITDEKPIGWDKFEKNPEKYKADLKQKEREKDIAVPVKTQKELIFELVEQNKNLDRKNLVKLIKNKLNLKEPEFAIQLDIALLKRN